jgi:hypothetical protein
MHITLNDRTQRKKKNHGNSASDYNWKNITAILFVKKLAFVYFMIHESRAIKSFCSVGILKGNILGRSAVFVSMF